MDSYSIIGSRLRAVAEGVGQVVKEIDRLEQERREASDCVETAQLALNRIQDLISGHYETHGVTALEAVRREASEAWAQIKAGQPSAQSRLTEVEIQCSMLAMAAEVCLSHGWSRSRAALDARDRLEQTVKHYRVAEGASPATIAVSAAYEDGFLDARGIALPVLQEVADQLCHLGIARGATASDREQAIQGCARCRMIVTARDTIDTLKQHVRGDEQATTATQGSA